MDRHARAKAGWAGAIAPAACALLLALSACDGSAGHRPAAAPDRRDAAASDAGSAADTAPASPPTPSQDDNHDDEPVETGRFVERVVISGLDKPVAVRFARDGRVFVAEKAGVIKQLAALGERAEVIADLRAEVHSYGDRGLLDLELDPDFPEQPYLYALYTLDGRVGDSVAAGSVPRYRDACPDPKGAGCVVAARLVRLTLTGELATTNASEMVLVENWAQQFSSHSIGSLTFGPDGFLYVAAGDGASFEHVDYGNLGGNPLGEPPDPSSTWQSAPGAMGGALRSQVVAPGAGLTPNYAGKVIRLDARHALPAGDPEAEAPVVIASGLRNPYRITLRPRTSELWLADVGWNEWEEINRIADVTDPTRFVAPDHPNNRPTNFGWPCYEGPLPQSGYQAAGLDLCTKLYAEPAAYTPPALTYHHWAELESGDGCTLGGSAVTGLAFYEGGGYPKGFDGSLFFTDYSRRCIWSAPVGADGTIDAKAVKLFARGVGKPVQLIVGPGNDLYYVDLDGTVRRFEYSTANHPPSATLVADRRFGPLPLTVKLDASGSTDPDAREALRFAWDLDGDGAYEEEDKGAKVSVTFGQRGGVTIGVRVTDARGASSEQRLRLWPGLAPPRPVIAATEPSVWRVGDLVTFAGYAEDANGGNGARLPASALTWSIIVMHCPSLCHEHPMQEMTGVTGGAFEAPDHDYPMHLVVRLTATDGNGLSASTDRALPAETTQVTVDSVPRGLRLAWNGLTDVTPFTRTVIYGSSNSLSAPSQVQDQVSHRFVGWSDGEAQDHLVTTRVNTATFVAHFEPHPLRRYERDAVAIVTHYNDEPSADDDPREVIRDGVRPTTADLLGGGAGELATWYAPPDVGADAFVGYRFATPLAFSRLVFQEGRQPEDGGFFDSIRVEVRTAGLWQAVKGLRMQPIYTGANGVPWESFVFDFEPTTGDAIRLIGRPGGEGRYVSVAELEVWAEAPGTESR